MNNGIFINPNNETYELLLIKKDEGNTPFNYGQEDVIVDGSLVGETHNPMIKFKGRPANSTEKKAYRISKGIQGTNTGVMILCSNLPDIADIGDRVVFLGQNYTIQSIGNYIDKNKVVNGGIFSSDYLNARSPKGITLG